MQSQSEMQVVVPEIPQSRGVSGVIGGAPPDGVEDDKGMDWREGFLRKIEYKA